MEIDVPAIADAATRFEAASETLETSRSRFDPPRVTGPVRTGASLDSFEVRWRSWMRQLGDGVDDLATELATAAAAYAATEDAVARWMDTP